MTGCKRTENAIVRRINDGMSLENIGNDLCEKVKDPKRKIIRIMKQMPEYGESWFADDENAKTHGYKNNEVKKQFEEENAAKLKRDEAKKIAEATDAEKKELTELFKEFKEKIVAEDDGKDWHITIKNCIKDIDIPKTVLNVNKKYPKNIKTLVRCLDNIDMTKKIVEFNNKYPNTFKDTINELVKNIKEESSELIPNSDENNE